MPDVGIVPPPPHVFAIEMTVLAAVGSIIYVWAGFKRRRLDDELRRQALDKGLDEKVCPKCRSEVPLDAEVCMHCNYTFRSPRSG